MQTNTKSTMIDNTMLLDTMVNFQTQIEDHQISEQDIQTGLNRSNHDEHTSNIDEKAWSDNSDFYSFPTKKFDFPPAITWRRYEYFHAIQKWEGHVLSVNTETFEARLTPIIGEGGDQDAEIFLDEIDEEDHQLIKPGALFYWSIGYLDRPSGRIRASIIRLQRLPNWTRLEYRKALKKAQYLKTLFDETNGNQRSTE